MDNLSLFWDKNIGKVEISVDQPCKLNEEVKTDYIKAFIKKSDKQSQEKQITDKFKRMKALVTSMQGSVWLEAEVDGALAVGLGNPSIVENGQCLDFVQGLPYIPGTALKGLLRAWAEDWDAPDPTFVKQVFGEKIESDSGSAGELIVFDAFPEGNIKFRSDIMTPHYGEYSNPENTSVWPGDWYAPTPIPFLTVSDGVKFGFGLAQRSNHRTLDMNIVSNWLQNSLETLGIGAKTSRGYGRFREFSKPECAK